jgi:hypothetical protein
MDRTGRAEIGGTTWSWTTGQLVALGVAIGALLAVVTAVLLGP